MKENTADTLPYGVMESQPGDTRGLPENERNALIVTAIQVGEHWIIINRYGDHQWELIDLPSNTANYRKHLNFLRVRNELRGAVKEVMYRYLRRGREGQPIPKGATLDHFFEAMMPFLRYLDSLGIDKFCAISPIVFTNYVAECREARKDNGKHLSQGTLLRRYQAIEALYELSQYTHDPIQKHPWPETSSTSMAGLTGHGSRHRQGSTTPLIPDSIFCALFERAYEKVEHGNHLLDLRDAVTSIGTTRKGAGYDLIRYAKKRHLATLGWKGGLTVLNQELTALRTACYIILASTSGCRNHELANVQSGSHRRTEDDDGTIFHWLHSKSEKTDAGEHDWMIPTAAVRALRLMERWAVPYQAMIANEIAERRRINPFDPEIAHAHKHRHALFLGLNGGKGGKGNKIRTLSLMSCNVHLKTFAKQAKLDWPLASHQFRRKFANYVAHSQFGDLRYLREHFAHWSMDMTLGYAMDESWGSHLDLELFDDIQAELEDIKLGVVKGWLGDDPLAGGYGRSLKHWQRDPLNLAIFKDHQTMVSSIAESTSIRSNGHAWCTADDNGCVGNTFERTRCGDCSNAVIGQGHLGLYRELYNNLKELLVCNDIGESGRIRVLRDMERCRDVFIQLGYDPEEQAA
ncbi:site-specific integrase [Pseudomonas sp. H3_H05]